MERELPQQQQEIEDYIIQSNDEIRRDVEEFLRSLEEEALDCKDRHLRIGSLLDDSLVKCGETMKDFRADRENKADEIRASLETAMELNMKVSQDLPSQPLSPHHRPSKQIHPSRPRAYTPHSLTIKLYSALPRPSPRTSTKS